MEWMARHGGSVYGRRKAHRHLIDVHASHHGEICAHHPLHRQILKLADLGGVQPELHEQFMSNPRRLIDLHELDGGTAFDNRPVKQALCGRHGEQRAHLAAAARLAEDRYRVGIASKLRDVLAHPLQRVNDIEHPDIARLREILSSEFL